MKRNYCLQIIALTGIMLTFGCSKKTTVCTTLKCGHAVVYDSNYGDQTVAQSGSGCFTDSSISILEQSLKAAWSSSRYDVAFVQDSTETKCQ